MSGYRVHSFDPNVHEQQGRPLRPFNWVQWTGVAIGAVGLVLTIVYLLGEIGWIPQWIGSSPPVFVLMLLGAGLINSRREPSTLVGSEQLAKNRRLLIITLAICAAVLAAVAVVEFSGSAQ